MWGKSVEARREIWRVVLPWSSPGALLARDSCYLSEQTIMLPALPAGYRITQERQASLDHLDTITAGLLHNPQVYWCTDRTPQVVKKQVEEAYSCVCILYRAERDDTGSAAAGPPGPERLAAWCRTVSDGVGIGYLADVFVVSRQSGLSHDRLGSERLNDSGFHTAAGTLWSRIG